MRLPLALTYALRDLRAGLQGFRIFLFCIILGVAGIGMVGSLSDAIERGLIAEGQPLLGGDAEITLRHRELDSTARAAIDATGRWSSIVSLRAMASAGDNHSLIELKAIDDAYPLFGHLSFDPPLPRAEIFSEKDGISGAAADPLLMARLGIKPGDRITLGESTLEIRASIAHEPDRAAQGFVLGPRLMITRDALAATNLLQPGSLASYGYRLRLADPAALPALTAKLEKEAPAQGFEFKTRDKAAPGLTRAIDQLGLFLTLVGLSALIVGGTGIANAVKAFLDRRTLHIAILKSLGASRNFALTVYLWEVMIVAGLGIAIALVPAALTPAFAATFLQSLLPVPVSSTVSAAPLLTAAAAGLLTAFAFSLWPLARASTTPAAGLFRGLDGMNAKRPGPVILLLIAAALAGLVLLARSAFGDARLTGWFILGLAASFVFLALVGAGLMRLARRLPKPESAVLGYALGNLYRPGAPTPAITIALGLGLTLFVTLALIDRNVTTALSASLPARAPAFFFLDVPDSAHDDFVKLVASQPGSGAIESVPMLRGRITKVKDTPAADVKPKHDGWVLSGDRGLTYAATLPQGSRLTAGSWWPEDYTGEPLVSLTADAADGLGLTIGDHITVNVLGREITARIANLREVDWRSLGINFVMVFTPATLKAAPHSNLMTVMADPAHEAQILNAAAAAFPAVTAVSVRDVLKDVTRLLEKLILAIRAANAVTLLTGVLVLAGALAGGLDARIRDAAILKTYGATRRQLMSAYVAEFAVSGLVTALFAIVAGGLAASAIITRIFELDFTFTPAIAILTALAGMAITIASGLTVTWTALALKPAGRLRAG